MAGNIAFANWEGDTDQYGNYIPRVRMPNGMATGAQSYVSGPYGQNQSTATGAAAILQELTGVPSLDRAVYERYNQVMRQQAGLNPTGVQGNPSNSITGPNGREAAGSSTASSGGGYASDPNSQAAIAYLNKVLSGENLPYDAATQGNMLSQAADMNAAAEQAQGKQMRAQAMAGGASAYDPSMAANQRMLMANRQAGNAQAARDIAQKANVANRGYQMQAAGTLADIGLNQSRFAAAQARNAMEDRLANTAQVGSGGRSTGGSRRVGGYGGLDMTIDDYGRVDAGRIDAQSAPQLGAQLETGYGTKQTGFVPSAPPPGYKGKITKPTNPKIQY